MALTLNHYSIRTTDLAACDRFYCGLLGLQAGPRPPFPFPGLWLYSGDTHVWAGQGNCRQPAFECSRVRVFE